jgi:pyruvate/2-oxoglutarate/acetoin dehydrogenase E1 component
LADAAALCTAIADPDPVLFLEHRSAISSSKATFRMSQPTPIGLADETGGHGRPS